MALSRGNAVTKVLLGALGLLALAGLFAASGAGGLISAPSPHAAPAPTHSVTWAKASPHPALGTISVVFSDPVLPAFSTPGSLTLFFNVSTVAASVNASFSNVSVLMIAELGTSLPYQDVAYADWAVPVTAATNVSSEAFQTTVDSATVLPNTTAWVYPANSWLPNGRYLFIAFATTKDTKGNTISGQAETGNISGHGDTQMEQATPSMQLWTPAPGAGGAAISPGATSVVAGYSGDWVTHANISVTNPDLVSVLQADLVALAPSAPTSLSHIVLVTTSAEFVVTGQYTVALTLTTAFPVPGHTGDTWTWTTSFNVTNATTVPVPVYHNQTLYHNQTVYENETIYSNNTAAGGGSPIKGVSSGGAAAILMVAGVIIGMIVALVLGRMMFSGASSAPAQPWSGSKSGGGANECSVCHQSFATEAELKDHQASAHGM